MWHAGVMGRSGERRRVWAAGAAVVLIGATVVVAVAAGDRLRPDSGGNPNGPNGSDGTSRSDADGAETMTRARALLAEPSEADTARSLATLRKVDDHPLYEMTYYGPAPRVDERPADQSLPAPAGEGRKPFACTVFAAVGDTQRPIFGRNFDWDPNPALILHANPTGAYRSVSIVDTSYLGFDRSTVADLDDPVKRTALMRAIKLPFDGMNEHGLVVGMASVDAVAEVKPGRPAVGSVAIMRLVLDQARTVDEGVAVLGSYNIDFDGGPGLHYILADATGASAIVEFVDGRMHVLPRAAGDTWQVMENFHVSVADDGDRNRPRYRTATQRLRDAGGNPGAPAALDLLREVAQNHTQWSAVYDLTTRSVSVYTDKRRDRVHEFPWPF